MKMTPFTFKTYKTIESLNAIIFSKMSGKMTALSVLFEDYDRSSEEWVTINIWTPNHILPGHKKIKCYALYMSDRGYDCYEDAFMPFAPPNMRVGGVYEPIETHENVQQNDPRIDIMFSDPVSIKFTAKMLG